VKLAKPLRTWTGSRSNFALCHEDCLRPQAEFRSKQGEVTQDKNTQSIAQNQAGFSLVEVMLSVAVFALIATVLVGAVIYARESANVAGQRTRATFLAQEGVEAVRAIRDQDFTTLAAGTYGLNVVAGRWALVPTPDVTDGFTRSVAISVQSETAMQITVTVNWNQTLQRTGTIARTENLTDWRPQHKAHGKVGGVLAYGNGGTSGDGISYRIMGKNNQWSSVYNTLDVDPSHNNRVLRAVRVYASPSKRLEDTMISEHYDGSKEYIYSQVYNQTNQTWGQLVLLASWSQPTFVNQEQFSGTYLDNGDFMAIYSDGTAVPKFQVWNGTSWSGQIAMQGGGSSPNLIVAAARPTTNEVMVAILGSNSTTQTQYFNGGTYTTANWSNPITQSTTADSASETLVDFTWSPNDETKGALAFASQASTSAVSLRGYTANTTGGGTWGTVATAPAQTKAVTSIAISAADSQDTYLVCDKDKALSIYCYAGDSTSTIHLPLNGQITQITDNGTERSYDVGIQSLFGAYAVIMFSDGSTQANLKTYDISSDTWDKNSTKLAFVGTTGKTTMNTMRLVPDDESEDIMSLMSVNNNDDNKKQIIEFYSAIWSGTDKNFYNGYAAKIFQVQGTLGADPNGFWYDFAWDPNFN